MKSVSQVMTALKKKGTAQTRKIYGRHGASDNMFGVKVADMKVIVKQIKGSHQLACELYDTGNMDAMYLAGMVADGRQMTKRQLDQWAKAANWYMISEYSVPGVTCESAHASALAMKWIKSKQPHVAACGWATYAGLVAVNDDDDLDMDEIVSLLDKVADEVHTSPNRVRYTMNGFVIAVGSYVRPLARHAKAIAKKIGRVEVEMGETSCKVPLASEYIKKVESLGRVGKKRKSIKC